MKNLNVRIEKMIKSHINEVLAVENTSFTIPWARKSFESELENEIAVYLVAKIDDKVVGYAGFHKVLDEGFITNIAVLKDFRNNGVGSMLLNELIREAYEDEIFSITLEVRKSNIIAQNLYSKYGFVEAGIRKGYYSDNGEGAVIMWRKK